MLVGAVEAGAAAGRSSAGLSGVLLSVLFGAGLLAPVGLLVGVGQWLVLAALGRIPLYRRAGAFIDDAWQRYRSGDRGPVILLFALGTAAAALVAGFVAALVFVVPRLWELPEENVGQALVIGIALLGVLGSGVALLPLAGAISALLRGIDRLVRLPYPSQPALRFALFVVAPAFALLVPFLRTHRAAIGPVAAIPVLLLFLAIEGLADRLLEALARVLRPSLLTRRLLPLLAIGISLAAFLATLIGYRTESAARAGVEGGFISHGTAELFRTLTDRDHDGFSALLGGGDCDGSNPAINPLAYDEPGNGIDENCDGADSALAGDDQGPGQLRRFYGKLAPEQVRHYNVVWIVVDAVRAGHVGALGYKRNTTPYIDQLARESLLFSSARSQSSGTDMSIPSMLVGRDPARMHWEPTKRSVSIGDSEVTVAQRLSKLGYATGIIVNAWVDRYMGDYRRGYDIVRSLYDVKDWKKKATQSSPIALARAIEVIEAWEQDAARAEERKPFFLTVYFEDPHYTYVTHGKAYANFGSKDLDRYDAEIAYADRHVGFLLEHLRQKPEVWKDTIVIVTADHGEEFKEHGGRRHARTCYEEVIRVPLVVRIPGVEPERIDAPVALVDIIPTLLELVGATEGADQELTGQSLLVPALAPDKVLPNRPFQCAVHSKGAHPTGFGVRAVVVGDQKLVHDLAKERFELYDLSKDPKEKKNLAEDPSSKQALKRLQRILRQSTGHGPSTARSTNP